MIFQRPPHCVASLKPSEGHLDLEELLRSGRRHDCVDVEANDPLYVLHTSGTTGRELEVAGYEVLCTYVPQQPSSTTRDW